MVRGHIKQRVELSRRLFVNRSAEPESLSLINTNSKQLRTTQACLPFGGSGFYMFLFARLYLSYISNTFSLSDQDLLLHLFLIVPKPLLQSLMVLLSLCFSHITVIRSLDGISCHMKFLNKRLLAKGINKE